MNNISIESYLAKILDNDFMLQFYTGLASHIICQSPVKSFIKMTLLAFIALAIFILSVSLLAYIFVGYPLLILLLAKSFRRPIKKRT